MANLRNPGFQVLLTFETVKETIDYLKWPLEYFIFFVLISLLGVKTVQAWHAMPSKLSSAVDSIHFNNR